MTLQPSRAFLPAVASAAPIVALVLFRPLDVDLPSAVYLPLHAAVEIVVAAVAVATFAVQWAAAGEGVFREARARFLAAAFLGVGALEVCHALVFPGMPGLFGPATTERGIYYWLAARAYTVCGLLVLLWLRPESDHPLLRRRWLIAVVVLEVAALVAVDAALPSDRAWFYVEGTGLTPLKRALEWSLSGLALVGAVVAWRRGAPAGARTPQRRVAAAFWAMALSEVCLSLYRTPYDLFNVAGHAYLLVAFWFLFDALFVAALLQPFRDLEALRAHVEGELVVSIRRLERLKEQREDFLRAVSHDLRNPLQVVLLQAERLTRTAAGQEAAQEVVRRPVAAIRVAGRRMERMLRDLTDSAQLEAGELRLERRPVDLEAFLDQLLEVEQGVLDSARVTTAVRSGLPPLDADPNRLDRILVNLVGNALKYSREEVSIGAEREGGAVRITIADRGAGIPPEDLPRIFDRYYRGQRHEGEGLGLGLFIVKRLVEAHGGTIAADSAPGAGSTFTLRMPVVGSLTPSS